MQIVVTMEKMLCAKPDNRWYFFRGLMGGNGEPEQTVICKGSMAWNPGEKETLALIGDWTLYKGERHFQFKSAKLTLPLEPRSQLHYVCQRTSGIGCTLEQQIWDARKEDWRNLERGEIKKMNDLVYDLFMDEIVNFDANSEKAEIISWLLNKGCTENMAAAAFEAWGKDTPGIVNANCYRLADLSGYSFKTVDENIRRHFEIGDHDPRRIKSAVIYAMQLETEDGSTAINCWRHFAACQKLLPNLGDEMIVRAVREMMTDGSVHVFKNQNMMSGKRDYCNERIIYDYVNRSAALGENTDLPSVTDEELSKDEKFTPDVSQLEAVRYAVYHRFAIINGGAGVGKTTVIKMIVRGIKATNKKLQIHLCAPTGKAAARLKEASGIEATTIHVMLGAKGNDVFSCSSLEHSAVIVDESSMVDSALLAEILKRNPSQVILVGDQAQLTPVGHGQPFHDIIALYPNVIRTLTKCYRNTEAVFQAATMIRNGNLPMRHAESEKERWIVVSSSDPRDAQKMICEWTQEGLLDFSTDIVLCPKNGTRGEDDRFQESTVNALNEELLFIDRTNRGSISGERFVSGDRVINTVNCAEKHVWNGTTGTVHAVQDDGVIVKLDVPYVDLLTGETEETVVFDKDMMKNLRYAYALTVHKSQGSQYRKVVMVVLPRDKFQLDRSLVYTGVTRTREECCVIGDYNALAHAIATTRKKDTVLQCMTTESEENLAATCSE